jgi:hypothetical protein
MPTRIEVKVFYGCVAIVVACAHITDHYPEHRDAALWVAAMVVVALAVGSFFTHVDRPQCPYCESMNVGTSIEHETLEYGLLGDRVLLEIDIPVQTCSDCKGMYVGDDAAQIREAAVQEMLADRKLKEPQRTS